MSSNIGERLQALRLTRDGAVRIAARVTVEFPEKGKLNFGAVAGAPTVVRTVVLVPG